MRFEGLSRLPRSDGDVWRLRLSDPALQQATIPTEPIVPVDVHLAVTDEGFARAAAAGQGRVQIAAWLDEAGGVNYEGGGVAWVIVVFPRRADMASGDEPDWENGHVSGPYPTYDDARVTLAAAVAVPATAKALLMPMTVPQVRRVP